MPLRPVCHGNLIVLGLGLLLTACAALQRQPGPPPESGTPDAAPATTRPWIETDAVVTIDNELLADHLRAAMEDLDWGDGIGISGVEVAFSDAGIGLAIDVRPVGEDGSHGAQRLIGEVYLTFSGTGLSWFPRLHHAEPGPAENGPQPPDLVRLAQSRLVQQLILPRENRLGFRLAPAQALTIAAALPGLGQVSAEQQFVLQGAFSVADQRMKIDNRTTTLALDLEFIEGLSHCDSDVSISRAAFARRVVNREPRDIEAQLDPGASQWHYFTEVSDARRNLTLVHYWFADGRAVGVTELPVEPSARWRTWSSLPVLPGAADQVEVYVADRDSGCILDAAHLESSRALREPAARESFDAITGGFATAGDRPQAATVELSRMALAEAFNLATAARRFPVRMEVANAPTQPISGFIDSLVGLDFQCQVRDCSLPTDCRADFAQCQRRQDTRNCATCLFRNPLNDRCVSERIDADCEARRAALNERYGAAFDSCIAGQETARQACELRGRDALEVCEQKARQEAAACGASRELLVRREAPLATLAGEAGPTGSVSLVFAGLQAAGNLERLKGELLVEPDLALAGRLDFSAEAGLAAVGQCIDGWDAPFQVRIDRPQAPRRLAGDFRDGAEELSVAWPGITLPLGLSRGPVAEILANRQQVAPCAIGLTPTEIGSRAGGESELLLRGLLPVDIQPGPVRIALSPVQAELGGRPYSATADGRSSNIRFDLKKSPAAEHGGARE